LVNSNPEMRRMSSNMVYDSNRKVTVLFGGRNYVNGNEIVLNDTWEYDGRSWKRILTKNSPDARY